MKPNFEWKGSADAEAGLAQWTIDPNTRVSLPLSCFATAHEVNKVVDAAYQAGLQAGRDGLAFSVEQAIAQAGVRRLRVPS